MTTFQIVRDHLNETPTTGTLTAGDLSLHTLEDPWLDNEPYISCIPNGTYQVAYMYSVRFQRDMPRLLGVPARTGILLHGGNTDADTEGCILLGMDENGSTLLHSQEALGYFVAWLVAVLATGPVQCEVTNA